jgi:hypothetical protein
MSRLPPPEGSAANPANAALPPCTPTTPACPPHCVLLVSAWPMLRPLLPRPHLPCPCVLWPCSPQARSGAAGTPQDLRRSSPIVEVSMLLAECVQHGLRTIAFCHTVGSVGGVACVAAGLEGWVGNMWDVGHQEMNCAGADLMGCDAPGGSIRVCFAALMQFPHALLM